MLGECGENTVLKDVYSSATFLYYFNATEQCAFRAELTYAVRVLAGGYLFAVGGILIFPFTLLLDKLCQS